MAWRLVDTDLCPPPYSAAADEAIASARAENTVPDTLHFYRRDTPTVSLGYFKSASKDVDLDFCRQRGISVIRRATGGSAVYTDGNHLIYALVTGEDTLPGNMDLIYEKVCSAIVEGLAILGVEADFKPINDVLVGGRKISGSAQMRRRGVVLQHGTLILDLDRETMFLTLRVNPEKKSGLTSLAEVLGKAPPLGDVKTALTRGFEKVFDVGIEPGGLTVRENDLIDVLISEKYGRDEWNLRR
jgi:lipoate-protein ligase A